NCILITYLCVFIYLALATSCPQLPTPLFGAYLNCNTRIGGRCRLYCQAGFVPSFNSEFTCQSNGNWHIDTNILNCRRLRRLFPWSIPFLPSISVQFNLNPGYNYGYNNGPPILIGPPIVT